jgi:hypothetical protein
MSPLNTSMRREGYVPATPSPLNPATSDVASGSHKRTRNLRSSKRTSKPLSPTQILLRHKAALAWRRSASVERSLGFPVTTSDGHGSGFGGRVHNSVDTIEEASGLDRDSGPWNRSMNCGVDYRNASRVEATTDVEKQPGDIYTESATHDHGRDTKEKSQCCCKSNSCSKISLRGGIVVMSGVLYFAAAWWVTRVGGAIEDTKQELRGVPKLLTKGWSKDASLPTRARAVLS